jgi:uncharacterized UBP type Zn finger protein
LKNLSKTQVFIKIFLPKDSVLALTSYLSKFEPMYNGLLLSKNSTSLTAPLLQEWKRKHSSGVAFVYKI